MVSIKILIEIVVIVIALAVLVYWVVTNYDTITSQFFDWMKKIGEIIKPS